MKYIVCSLLFGFIYWISGTGLEQKYKVWLKSKWVIEDDIYPLWIIAKEIVRRKNLMAVAMFVVLSIFTGMGLLPKLVCALTIWSIHFFGYWEALHMSFLRGLLEAVAFIPLMFFTGNWAVWPVVACVVAFFGANILSRLDPHIKIGGKYIDWWWVCSGFLGACLGIGIALAI